MKKFLNLYKKGGFTLIELLIVIAIIGLLTGIVMANLTQSKAKARDAKRISDMGQIQLALELYFDRCQRYPDVSPEGGVDIYSTCKSNTVALTNFISKIPQPTPEKEQIEYGYYVDDNNSDYYLKAVLEGDNEALKDGMTSFGFNGDTENCDNTSPVFEYCIGPK